MKPAVRYLTPVFSLLAFLLIFPACDRAVEEEVVRPIELMYGQKDVAAEQVAVSNVQTVRAALMRYQADSPSGQYPGDMEIYDYGSLRETLADANLPRDIAELMWDPAYGITYHSDGSTFNFEVRALTQDREIINATPGGINKD